MNTWIGRLVLLLIFSLAGCGGGGGGDTTPTNETFAVEGRVLNGVLVGSTVEIFGANGEAVLATVATDAEGRYAAKVSRAGPYRLHTSGGKLNGVDYTGILDASCATGSGCLVTPYTTVLLRLVDEHGFNPGDAEGHLANIFGFDGDPFAGNVPAGDFDLDVARQAIAGGDGLGAWVASVVAWAIEDTAEPPPGMSEPDPAEPPLPPVDPEPVPVPDPDPEPIVPVTYTVSATAGAGGSIDPTSQTLLHGDTATFTLLPETGYSIDQVVGCDGSLDGNTYTTGTITGVCTVQATFALNQYTLSYAAGVNGALGGKAVQTVTHGSSGTAVTAVAADGYRFVQWSDGVLTAARTDTNVTADLSVTAGFEADSYTVTFDANGGSAPSPVSIEVTHGQPYGALALVNRVGHEFLGWFTAVSDGAEVTAATTATITAPQTLYAQWKESEYTVTVGSITGGSLSPTSATVVHGNTAAFTLSADAGYDINDANLSGCDGALSGATYTTGVVTGDCTITGSLDLMVYTLSYTAGVNGALGGEAVQTVTHGSSGTAVTAVPDTGYSFVEWSDGLTTAGRTDSNVNGDLSVTASFRELDLSWTLKGAELAPVTVNEPASYDLLGQVTLGADVNPSDIGPWSGGDPAIPEWLNLSPGGLLTGTPLEADIGLNQFQVEAIGLGETQSAVYTINVGGFPLEVIQISAGDYHTCAVTTSGGAKCWGWNAYGQLGNGSTSASSIPVDVDGLTENVASISTYGLHTCAVTTSGGAKCWGYGGQGLLGNGLSTDSSVPVDVAGLNENVALISAGSSHTCVVTTSGGAKCWGVGREGQLGNGLSTDSSIPVDVDGLTENVASISANGGPHTCAVTTSGAAKCWGQGSDGQLGNDSTDNSFTPVTPFGLESRVTSISTGSFHTCAVTTDGGAKCWGWGIYGQLGAGLTASQTTPVDVTELTSNVTSISAGGTHTCAVYDGGAKCWGWDNQLGNRETDSSNTPVDVAGLTENVALIDAGSSHTCVVTTSGGAKCWGFGGEGQLGNGLSTDSEFPVRVLQGKE